ncbi:MAG: HDOD domain-containing protein [Armatimonadetes bacterium]|nr:HDOD domain-containing protein [Armatimonadota bacterium]
MNETLFQAKFEQYRRLIGTGAFPKTFKGVVSRIIAISQDPGTSAKDLANIVSVDPAISTKVMTVVNSPFYGLSSEVCDLAQAISLLGFEEAKKIALSVSVFEGFKRSEVLELLRIWKHCICSGIFARIIAEHVGHFEAEAYTTGLLHDVGMILLYSVKPYAIRSVQSEYMFARGKASYLEVENKLLGIDHTWIGYCAACQWNLPLFMREAIFSHHEPELPPSHASKTLARIVHLADLVADASGHPSVLAPPNSSPENALSEITDDVLRPLQMDMDSFSRVLSTMETAGMTEARNFISTVEASISPIRAYALAH